MMQLKFAKIALYNSEGQSRDNLEKDNHTTADVDLLHKVTGEPKS